MCVGGGIAEEQCQSRISFVGLKTKTKFTNIFYRSLELTLDERYTQMKAAVDMKYQTLHNFVQTTTSLSAVTELLPTTAGHFKDFLAELGQSREVIDWLASTRFSLLFSPNLLIDNIFTSI